MRSKPSIYAYLNYRSYLKDMWEYLKTTHGYSNRSFAQMAKIKSPTHFFLVMSGKREMTAELLKKISRAFSLRVREAEFFEALVQFSRAKTTEEQDSSYRKILSFKQFAEGEHLREETHDYYSQWYHVALFEALGTPLALKSPEEIGRLLKLTPTQTDRAFANLEKLGLIEKIGDVYRRVRETFETPAETSSLLVRAFHREMIQKAIESIDAKTPDERKLMSVTLPLDLEGLKKFSSKLFDALREVGSEVANSNSPDGIYQVNLQLFPLLQIPRAKKDG